MLCCLGSGKRSQPGYKMAAMSELKGAKILVVGGAGYVGSTATTWLIDQGCTVWILDDLSTGFRSLLHPKARFTQSRAGDRARVGELLKAESFDAVMHFAAKALAGESVEKPAEYHENNVT